MTPSDDDLLRAVSFEVHDDMGRVDASLLSIVGIGEQLLLAAEDVHRVVRSDELVVAVPVEVGDHG